MPERGWKQLLANHSWFEGRGKYPIPAYSEFMPPPRVGRKPCGSLDRLLFQEDDPWGWHVSEYEELSELRPGLAQLGHELVGLLHHLGRGEPCHGISRHKLSDNPYWPEGSQAPESERYVLLMPLALSRTQDDKGRVRWTLFGCSEQGPSKAFWRSFYTAPRDEWPVERSLDFVRRLISAAYGLPLEQLADLQRAGFRVLPEQGDPQFASWRTDKLPRWTEPYLLAPGRKLGGVKYLLTFEPLDKLPAALRRAYFAGELHLLPFPGSLAYWGTRGFARLAAADPYGLQIPLLHSTARREAPGGLRIPQSGWMHEPRPGAPILNGSHGPVRNTFQRTHRWSRVHRYEDELAVTAAEDRVAHVLFSTQADDLGLYGKPMARNAQVWTRDFEPLLNGPRCHERDLIAAAEQVEAGGLFGYRFFYPPMRVGRHEVIWQRPLVAYLSPQTGQAATLTDAPLGYLTAYRAEAPRLDGTVELWPRLLQREPQLLALEGFRRDHDQRYHRTSINLRKLLETSQLFGAPLEPDFARCLLTMPKHESLDDWLESLPGRAVNPEIGRRMLTHVQAAIAAAPAGKRAAGKLAATSRPPASLSFARTAKRAFEEKYWNTIAELATGQYINKDNADTVTDPATQARLAHPHRDLEALGDHLLDYYRRLVGRLKMTDDVLVGELPFRWRTEFPFPWMGGWVKNQQHETCERDLLVVIPGRDRSRAVVMGDHYDTAYMEDVFGYAHGGHGPRLSAAGADDNHSATAALMFGAEAFLELSRAGKLGCDVWLVHLTGEEFPSDCMGARHLAQQVVQGTLELHTAGGKRHDLSQTRVQGAYILDMVAHNNDRDRDVFQICPGTSRESMWLAYQAHRAAETWNRSVPVWNERADRRGANGGRRSPDGQLPKIARHPHLHGEVRPAYDPRSTLYNTDGQIFSDAGIPVVLFMENYDINRQGYHDTHDTLENIDLDYGAAVAAIAIESVARAASETPPRI